MKKRFTILFGAFCALMILISMPGKAVGQVSSATPANGNSYVVAVYVSSKYYALPNGVVSSGTISGTEITLNAINKVNTSDATGKTWTLEEGTGDHAGQYYIKYTSGSDTYYLYKNGTSTTNYKFAVNKTSKNYWSFTANGTGYTVTAVDRGSNNLNIQYNNGAFRCYSDATAIRLLEIGNVPSYTVTAVSNNTEYGTVSLSGFVITGSPKTGYQYASPAYTVTSGTATVSQSGNAFTVTPSSNCTVRINFEEKPKYTASFSVNGTITSSHDYEEYESITFPDDPDDVNGKTFVGWATAAIPSITQTAPSFVTSATMGTAAVTFYAVFANAASSGSPSLTKMTSSDGFAVNDKVVIVASDNIAMYQETYNSSYVSKYTFDNTASTVAADNKKWFTVSAGSNGTWKLGDGTNGYVYNSSSNNLAISKDSSTDFTLGWNSTENKFTLKSGSRWLSYRSDLANTYFRMGGTNTEPSGVGYFDIYKFSASTVTYSNYCTTVPAENTWTVTYNANGGTGEDLAVPGYANNATVTVKPNTGDGNPNFTRAGYTFDKWNTENNGSGTSYSNPATQSASATFTITEDITLYAQWTAYEHNITKSAMTNGSVTVKVGGNEVLKAHTDETVTLEVSPNTNYVLESLTVTQGLSTVTLSQTFSPSIHTYTFTMPAGDVNVSASFKIAWTVQFSVNGTVNDSWTKVVEENEEIGELPTPSDIPEGYVYQGWTNTQANPGNLVNTTYTPSGNITLYASFKKIVGFSYDKVSSLSNVTDGEYIITAYASSEYYTLKNEVASSSPLAYEQTVTDNKITGDVSDKTWVFTFNNSAITIESTANKNYYLTTTNNNSGVRVNTTSGTWSIDNGSTSGTFKLTYESLSRDLALYSTQDWRTYSSNSGQKNLTLFKKTATLSNEYYVRIYPSDVTAESDITIYGPTIIGSDCVLNMGTHTLAIDGGSLIIEDGGQLILRNNHPAITATVKKNISAGVPETRTAAQNWYIISSSVNAPYIKTGTNLITGTTTPNRYDLYRYDEPSATWENYKSNPAHSGFNVNQSSSALENGRGYLYRNESAMTIEFTGNVNTSASYTVTAGGPAGFEGFNLLGNPYTHEIYKGGAFPNSGTSGYELSTGFYRLNSAGGWEAGTDSETAIAPNEGILIQATKGGTITIDNTTNKTRYNNEYLQFTVANSEYEDVAYAWFDKGAGLNKINHRNAEIPMLYINQEGQDYAIATMNDDTKTFNLNFKAMTTGKYTLSYKANGEFKYLHVIDRLTGEDVDMLLEGEYSFIGSTNDSDARFIVKLGYMPNYSDAENDIFAYQNGSEILVSGEGELQIFDVTGRNVMTTTVNGAESINISTQGVYIFRLVGNEVKTQKIVVR